MFKVNNKNIRTTERISHFFLMFLFDFEQVHFW